jgi:multidrug efflux pump subunit AcrA (membrane-fusion protein)
VQRGNVEETLEFSGRWMPRDQYALAFEINGTISKVNVQRGDTVTAGQLLASYDTTDLEDQLTSAQLDLETTRLSLTDGTETSEDQVLDAEFALASANLSLESTKDNAPWTSVESALIQLEDARRDLENAQRSYDDAVSHASNSASMVDNAYQALENAKSSVRKAELNYYSSAQSFNNHNYDVANAENTQLQRQLALESAQASGGISAQDAQSLRSAQLKIDQINADIARASLYAPVDGVVLEVTVKPGDSAQSFVTVITIAQPEPSEIISSMAFNDTQRLDVGMVGTCQAVNRPETAVQCAVRQLPLSSRDADQTVRLGARLDEVADMALGQVVDVVMPLQVQENVLWLPPEAIRTFQSRTFVVLQTPDGEQVSDVVLGLQTDDRVEIISGVNEGDIVVAP